MANRRQSKSLQRVVSYKQGQAEMKWHRMRKLAKWSYDGLAEPQSHRRIWVPTSVEERKKKVYIQSVNNKLC